MTRHVAFVTVCVLLLIFISTGAPCSTLDAAADGSIFISSADESGSIRTPDDPIVDARLASNRLRLQTAWPQDLEIVVGSGAVWLSSAVHLFATGRAEYQSRSCGGTHVSLGTADPIAVYEYYARIRASGVMLWKSNWVRPETPGELHLTEFLQVVVDGKAETIHFDTLDPAMPASFKQLLDNPPAARFADLRNYGDPRLVPPRAWHPVLARSRFDLDRELATVWLDRELTGTAFGPAELTSEFLMRVGCGEHDATEP